MSHLRTVTIPRPVLIGVGAVLMLVLRGSTRARRGWARVKRRWPRFGDLADRAMRRPSALRRRAQVRHGAVD